MTAAQPSLESDQSVCNSAALWEAMVEIRLEKDKCITSGQCVMAAPAVFDQDDEGIVLLLDEDPPESEHAAVREAATVCPAQLIHLAE